MIHLGRLPHSPQSTRMMYFRNLVARRKVHSRFRVDMETFRLVTSLR
jgi:hypothetical protein